MKYLLKLVSVSALLGLCSVAVADGQAVTSLESMSEGSGFYAGGGVGYGLSHWDNFDGNALGILIDKDHGVSARAFVGYNLNRQLGVEFGWAYLPSDVNVNGLGDVQNWAFDLTGKVYAPLFDQVGAFARLGINYLYSEARGDLKAAIDNGTLSGGLPAGSVDTRRYTYHVTYGAGLYWDWTSEARIVLEWLRYNSGDLSLISSQTRYQPAIDAFLLSVSYKIPSLT